MFKINKLQETSNENITISFVNQETCIYDKGIKKADSFKTLSFNINGKVNNNEYTLSFDLNCKLEELLKFKQSETINLKKHIYEGETFLNINNIAYEIDLFKISIVRYLKNKYLIYIIFVSDDYTGVIEFAFNLDDYIKNN